MVRWVSIVPASILLAMLAAPAFGVPSTTTRQDKAALLYREAQRRLVENSVDSRHAAIEELEEAVRLAPGRVDCWILLGQARNQAGWYEQAKIAFERAKRLAPTEPAVFMELGAYWKREWLKYLEPSMLDSARANGEYVVKLRPYSCDAWLSLAALRFENSDLDGAADATVRARRAKPDRADAKVSEACLAYRRGDIEHADSLFRRAIPDLRSDVRKLYEDITPVAGTSDSATLATLPRAERGAFLDRFWKRIDPDPTTPENEAQLEYWSRATYAYMLFRDPLRPALDARAQLYLRYGPPQRVAYNPLGVKLWFKYKTVDVSAKRSGGRAASQQDYPLNAMVWEYPDVDMRVVLQDRMLNDTFDFPFERDDDGRSTPNRELLAQRTDLISTGAGRGLFPTRPPRAQRLDLRGIIARFAGERGPHVLAQVDAPGAPGDSVYARWVVQDSAGNTVAHGAGPFATSACDPTGHRVADVSADLAPGDYLLILSAHDGRRHRGLYRAYTHLEPPRRSLGISDVILTCGTAGALASPGAIRIDADLGGVVPDRSAVTAYFELYGLAPGSDGVSRFEYQYLVQPIETGKGFLQRMFSFTSSPNVVTVRREEMQQSSMRRQFVSIPVQSLRPGRYRLEIRIKDLVAGVKASGSTTFEKLPPVAAQDTEDAPGPGGMR